MSTGRCRPGRLLGGRQAVLERELGQRGYVARDRQLAGERRGGRLHAQQECAFIGSSINHTQALLRLVAPYEILLAMRKRHFWLEALDEAWRRRSVVWLSGVRRSGKTTLARSLPGAEYFDCELPRARRELADPEAFLAGLRDKTVVLDEIHRLGDPAQLLEIGA